MRTIHTEIEIKATAEKVWQVLTDFENYPNWNPFIKRIEGEQKVGGKLLVKIQPPNTKEMTFKPTVLAYEGDRELRWLGSGPIKGLFDGEHSFQLEEQNNGNIKFKHGEKFKGILVGLMGKTLDKTKMGFEQMNEALKRECEN